MKNLDKLNLLKAYKTKEDKFLISNVLEKLILSEYEITFTDFLDPLKAGTFISQVKSKTFSKIMAYGGYESAERVKLGFFPPFEEADTEKFPIDIISVTYNQKYSKVLEHREFLGSVLGLGIERCKIGDIILAEGKAFVFAASDISDYISSNLTKVSKTAVSCEIYAGSVEEFLPRASEKHITVSSMRLDALVSEAFNISRGKASDYISAEKVFVNWSVTSSNSKKIEEGDIITLRGKGRVKISEIKGTTKKERISLILLKY